MDFIFQFVNMVYHIDWFAYIEESLHPWNKPNLIVVYELFDVLLQEDPLEESMATHSNILEMGFQNPVDRRAWWIIVHGVAK